MMPSPDHAGKDVSYDFVEYILRFLFGDEPEGRLKEKYHLLYQGKGWIRCGCIQSHSGKHIACIFEDTEGDTVAFRKADLIIDHETGRCEPLPDREPIPVPEGVYSE
jgi:hypothetical protein